MNQSFDLSSFDKHSRAEWIETVSAELKGKTPDEVLSWSHIHNLNLKPIYFEEDQPASAGAVLHGTGTNAWLNLAPITARKGKVALEELRDVSESCDGYSLPGVNDLEVVSDVLKHVPEGKFIRFAGLDSSSVGRLMPLIGKDHRGSFGLNPFRECGDDQKRLDAMGPVVVQLAEQCPNFEIITIPGNEWVDQGADPVLELALTLAQLTTYYEWLIGLGVDGSTIVSMAGIHTAMGPDYGHEIAKVRAYRKLVTFLQQCYGLPVTGVKIHASCSHRYKSGLKKTNNLIRQTIEAMAAVVGGCDTLCIQSVNNDKESRDMALDVSNLLMDESYLGRVVDPAAGSYFLENLTERICSAAWRLFQEIDQRGGYLEVSRTGWIAEQLGESRERLTQEMENEQIHMVNVNRFDQDQQQVEELDVDPGVFRLSERYEREERS